MITVTAGEESLAIAHVRPEIFALIGGSMFTGSRRVIPDEHTSAWMPLPVTRHEWRMFYHLRALLERHGVPLRFGEPQC